MILRSSRRRGGRSGSGLGCWISKLMKVMKSDRFVELAVSWTGAEPALKCKLGYDACSRRCTNT